MSAVKLPSALLVVPVVIALTAVASVVVHGELSEQHRQVVAEYDDAYLTAIDQHEAAASAVAALEAARTDAEALRAAAAAVIAQPAGYLTQADVDALGSLVAALDAEPIEVPDDLPDPPAAVADGSSTDDYRVATAELAKWNEQFRAEWAGLSASASAALRVLDSLRDGTLQVAETAATAGQQVLDGNLLASTETRDALAAAMTAMAAATGDVSDEIAAYVLAAQAVQASAAANAPPPIESDPYPDGQNPFYGGVSDFGVIGTYEWAYNLCHSAFDSYLANGQWYTNLETGELMPPNPDLFWPCTSEGPGYYWVVYG